MNAADDYLKAKAKATAQMERELRLFVRGVDWTDPLEARDELVGGLPELVEQWGSVLAEQALLYAESMITAPLSVAEAVPWDAIIGSIKWAITPMFGGDDKPDPKKRMENNVVGSMKRHGLQPSRDTLENAANSGGGEVGWARVLRGERDCAFCVVLASRGAVYSSRETAGGRLALSNLSKHKNWYHDFCDCDVVLIKGPDDWPRNYDPDEFYDKYAAVHTSGDTIQSVSAKMRKKYGMH